MLTSGTALSAADSAAIAGGSCRCVTARLLDDLGSRDERSERETYRIVAGVRGEFADNFNYEVSANYGEVNEATTILGNIVPQRLLLALDAVRDPNTGQIVCRSRIDPNAAVAYDSDDDLASDIAACVP